MDNSIALALIAIIPATMGSLTAAVVSIINNRTSRANGEKLDTAAIRRLEIREIVLDVNGKVAKLITQSTPEDECSKPATTTHEQPPPLQKEDPPPPLEPLTRSAYKSDFRRRNYIPLHHPGPRKPPQQD